MKSKLPVITTALMVLSVSCANADRVAVARLSAGEQESDPVFVQEIVRGSFYVENIGTDPFRIANVKSTCSCTTAVQTKGTVAPGERAEIEYDMGSASPRQRSVTIIVQTNPPLPEPLRFTATGTWKPAIETDADSLSIEARFGEPIEASIPLRPAPGVGPIQVTGAKTRQSWADVSLSPSSPEEGALPSLIVRSRNAIQPGTHKLGIAVEFERNEPGRQDMTLDVVVQSDFTIEPSQLMVELAPGQPKPTVELTIRNEKGTPFVPRSIRAEPFPIERPDIPSTPAPAHVIPVTFDLKAGPAPRRGKLLVDLGDKNGVFEVNVFFAEQRVQR